MVSIFCFCLQIGGGNIPDKAAALHFLASKCEGLVFLGMMSFQIMHALELSVPSKLVDHRALKESADIVQFAQSRNVQIVYPKDFWCMNDQLPNLSEIFHSHSILDGEIARHKPSYDAIFCYSSFSLIMLDE